MHSNQLQYSAAAAGIALASAAEAKKEKKKKDGRRTFDWMCKSRWHQHEGFPFHLKSAPWISSSLLLSLQFERSRTRPE